MIFIPLLNVLKTVLDGHALGNPSMLAFRYPEAFVVGNLHGYLPSWERISKCAPDELTPRFCTGSETVLTYANVFNPSKGNIRGKAWSPLFPRQIPFVYLLEFFQF